MIRSIATSAGRGGFVDHRESELRIATSADQDLVGPIKILELPA